MFDKGDALLLWTLECQPEISPEWNEWYNREHVAALLQVPGFISGNRYEKVEEGQLPSLPPTTMPLYLSFYELYDASVLESEAYQINRNSRAPGMRPEWTKRMMTYITRVQGGTYQPLTDTWLAGTERSAHTVWALFLNPLEGQESAVDDWYREQLLPSLQRTGAVAASRLFGAYGVSPEVKGGGEVKRIEGPRRIVLTAVRDSFVTDAVAQDTWTAVSDKISSAAGVLYRRMSL